MELTGYARLQAWQST